MPTNYNRSVGLRFREMCALVLEAAGLPVSTEREWKKPSEIFAAALDETPEPTTKGDLAGLPDWAFITRAAVSPGGYSEALATAEAIASLEGRKYAALLQWRSGVVRNHYAILNLSDFASLLAELESLKQESAGRAASASVPKEDSQTASAGAATVD